MIFFGLYKVMVQIIHLKRFHTIKLLSKCSILESSLNKPSIIYESKYTTGAWSTEDKSLPDFVCFEMQIINPSAVHIEKAKKV